MNSNIKVLDFKEKKLPGLGSILMNVDLMKQSKYRTTSNPKKLMRTAADLKVDLNQKSKKLSVREIRNRTDLATELLARDKVSSALA